MTGCEGQDWSSYQSSTPSTAGLAFAMVKATEGTGYLNPLHATQVSHARSAGLVVGHYHFQRPGSPTAQAAYFLAHAAPKPGDLLACDWEDTGVSDADKNTFIRAVRAAQPGLKTLLYCNLDFWLHRDKTGFAGDGLWIADPTAPKGAPRIKAPWTFHQYSFAGGVDRDFCPLTATQLRAFASGTAPTPENDVAKLDKDDYTNIAKALLGYDGVPAARPPHANDDYKTNPTWTVQYALQAAVEAARTACDAAPTLSDAQVAALGQQLAGNTAFVSAFADAVAANLANRLES